MMQIDQQTYKIGEKNRYSTQTKKTQLILSLSLRKDSYHITRLKHKDYGNTKTWCTYTISRDGTVYEHYNPKYYTDYIGLKQIDKNSISIVLENMGALRKTNTAVYMNWINELCPDDLVVEKKWLDQNYWELIPEVQLDSTVQLCKYLCDKFDIPERIIDFQHHHQDTIKFNGIVFKSNYFEDSTAVNPLLDINYLKESLELYD